MDNPNDRVKFACSFCDKSGSQVKKLIAGSKPGLFICDGCVALCQEILEQDGPTNSNDSQKQIDG